MNNNSLSLLGQLHLMETRGYSAYEVAVINGFEGTEEEWLASLVGPQGPQGPDGRSAYQVAVDNGYIGTESDWVNDFMTPDGYYNKEEIDVKMNKKPYYFDSVAQMKLSSLLKEGDMVVTTGYYEVNDGGAALYKIVEEESETEYQEELENGLYATLITDKVLNCKYLDLQKLLKIDNLKLTTNNETKEISEILLDDTNNLEIINSSFEGNTTKSLFYSHTINNPERNITIKNSKFTDYLYNQFGYTNNLLVDNSSFSNATGTEPGEGYGLLIGHTKNAKINNCYFEKNMRHSLYAGVCDNLTITNNTFYQNRYELGDATYLATLNISRGTQKAIVANNKFIECESLCLNVATDDESSRDYMEDILIDNNEFLSTIGKDIKIGQQLTASETLNVRNVIIQNNLFYKNGNYETIHVYNGENVVIKGNTFNNVSSENNYYIIIDNTSGQLKNIIIEDNIFEGYATNPITITSNANTSTCNIIIRNNYYSKNNGQNNLSSGSSATNPNMIVDNFEPSITLDNETTLYTRGSNFVHLTGTATLDTFSCNSDELTIRLGSTANISISSSTIVTKSSLTAGNMYIFKKDSKDDKWYEI